MSKCENDIEMSVFLLPKVRISRCHFWVVDESTIFAPLSHGPSFMPKKGKKLREVINLAGKLWFYGPMQWLLSNAQKSPFLLGERT